MLGKRGTEKFQRLETRLVRFPIDPARPAGILARMGFSLGITPQGHLHGFDHVDEPALADPRVEGSLREAFARGPGPGLLSLTSVPAAALTPPLRWAREWAANYLTRVCHTPDLDASCWPDLAPPDAPVRQAAVSVAPPMRGLEYLTAETMAAAWIELDRATRVALADFGGPAQAFLASIHPDWRLVGRVTFHLAENKRNPELPFAFLATYTEKLSAQSKPQYLPLSRAVKEYADAGRRDALLSLLTPVQRAAAESPFVKELVDSGAIYRAVGWTPREAYRFLQEIPRCEQAGVLVRVPDWWKSGRPSRPLVSVEVGQKPSSGVGLNAMLDFSARVTLDGVALSAEEWRAIQDSTAGLVPLRGHWVEVDREKLDQALAHFKKANRLAGAGVSFADAMRLLAGSGVGAAAGVAALDTTERPWVGVTAGPWLEATLNALRDPAQIEAALPLDELRATLRPYQLAGARWLLFMARLGLGACLADDMGLGKTLQLITLLLALRRDATLAGGPGPSLLVAPASLLANWRAEIERFAPSLRIVVLHPAELPADELDRLLESKGALDGVDLVITTYGMVLRQDRLTARTWRVLALDEAQAIKNPGTRQSRAIKGLPAAHRIALTGTPVENRLSDLWSLFDFLNPGLLGSAPAFSQFAKQLDGAGGSDFGPLRALVRPYILRRLKTDRTVIADLPDKTEVTAFCPLAPAQAALYQRAVRELAADLKQAPDEQQRRGLVLTYLMRFKQICNHPSHWLGDGVYAEAASGKFARLRELVEELAGRQERALVFTQFRELTGPLSDYLGRLYGRPGLVLHGGTPVPQRRKLVEAFQREDGPPFFVLSLKAGGVGLNLTAASQVIHFDRWWNPAVENQATDRAFRIGQKRNVLVHKFVCRGTLEERIDELIASKRDLADALLGGGAEKALTEMSNEELVRFVSLDVAKAELA
jgi:superfamily II DNA or RNA helicase